MYNFKTGNTLLYYNDMYNSKRGIEYIITCIMIKQKTNNYTIYIILKTW